MGEGKNAGVNDAEAVLLDTDVFSDLLRGGDRAAPWLPLVTGRYALVSFITAGELKAWAEIRNWGAARRADLDTRLGSTVVVPYDAALDRRIRPGLRRRSSQWACLGRARPGERSLDRGDRAASGRRPTDPQPPRLPWPSRPRTRVTREARARWRAVLRRPPASELSAASGVARPVLYALLKTLEGRGEVAKEQLPAGTTGYRLGAEPSGEAAGASGGRAS